MEKRVGGVNISDEERRREGRHFLESQGRHSHEVGRKVHEKKVNVRRYSPTLTSRLRPPRFLAPLIPNPGRRRRSLSSSRELTRRLAAGEGWRCVATKKNGRIAGLRNHPIGGSAVGVVQIVKPYMKSTEIDLGDSLFEIFLSTRI